MARNGKVIVAMSGGVDSSVAACLLKEQGYECAGMFMRLGARPARHAAFPPSHVPTFPPSHLPTPERPRRLRHGCCSAADAIDAWAIAGRLGIPFYALNCRADFDRIIGYFVDEYAQARTPNPCVLCNMHLKFGKLLRYADLLDAEFVATGHYARILRGNVGTWERGNAARPPGARPSVATGQTGNIYLARALNLAKDQSYVLFGIQRDDLRRCLFPLGEMVDKASVRRIAADLGLRVHDKPESQEICFVPNNDYRPLVRARRPETQRPGEVRDSHGNVLGTHEGIANYTVGQRRGLGIAIGKPIYVTKLDAPSNTVTVGLREELLSGGLVADQMNWLTDPLPVGEWKPAEIKIRYMHPPAPGAIHVLDGGVPCTPADEKSAATGPPLRAGATIEARFDEPQPAVTPGQAAVCYDRDGVVLGGGWIRCGVTSGE